MMVAKPSSQLELMTVKTCRRCGISKLLSGFYRLARSPDGRENTCIDCRGGRTTENNSAQPKRIPHTTLHDGKNTFKPHKLPKGIGKRTNAVRTRCSHCGEDILADIRYPSHPVGIYIVSCLHCGKSMVMELI